MSDQTTNANEITTYGDLNPSARLACALLLDTSTSMDGAPIAALNEGVRRFFQEVLADDFAKYSVEAAIYTFGGSVNRAQRFTSLANVESYQGTDFYANGGTPLGQAVEAAIHDLEEQKRGYRNSGVPYYRPWLVIITDGEPTDPWQNAAQLLHTYENERKLVTLGVFVGNGTGVSSVLPQICPPSRPPKVLHGLRFKEFFCWLSASMKSVSRSSPGDNVKLPATGGWDSI